MAVKHSNNENFIATILSLPDDVQFDLKFFIETTLEQVDSGKIASGDFILGKGTWCRLVQKLLLMIMYRC